MNVAAQEFIAAADAVFFKAQGLAMLAPLRETAFGLLEVLLDNWCLLNLDSVEWPCEAEVCQVCVNLWSLNKQAPCCADFGKTVGKGKAKAMEDDEDKEGEATQKLSKELEDFMVPTKSKGCLWNGIGIRMQKKCPSLAALVIAKHVKLVQAAKAFLEQQGKSSQFFILEGYKGKGKAKALLGDSEQAGAKQSFKLMELVDSNSNEKEEEDRVHIIKKIKREHVEELTGTRKRKEIIELKDEVEIMVPKTPVAGPLHQTSKSVVLVPSMLKPIPKPIIALASPVAGPSTAPIVPSSVSKPAAAAALSKPAPVKSARPAIKGGSIVKDPFMVTEVPVTQETLQDEESSDENNKDGNDDEDGKGDDDDSDNDDATMDVDSAKHPEETQPAAPTKAMLTKLKRTPFFQSVLY
ncbi:hypothetical protein C0995_005103 [Termitomyces sp. Mi166|nr:hypothetical protein C0995_005103 [Termitomyces sp. Mi166\